MVLGFAASLVLETDALAAPKVESSVSVRMPRHKQMNIKYLGQLPRPRGRAVTEITAKSEVQNNAYSMHPRTKTLQTASPWRVLASHGLG